MDKQTEINNEALNADAKLAAEKGPENPFLKAFKQYYWQMGLVFTLLLFFVIIEIRHPYMFLQDDNRDLGLPNFVHAYRSLMNGEIALFNFHQYLGTPFMAMGQWLVFYPFTYLSVFLSQLFLGNPDGTIDIFVIMHLLAGAVGFFMFLKVIEIKNPGAFFGALLWSLNNFVFFTSNSWGVIAFFAGLFPWIMYFTIKLYKKFDWKCFIALILFQSCYTGYVQLFLYGMVFEALTILMLVLFDLIKKNKLFLVKFYEMKSAKSPHDSMPCGTFLVLGKCKFIILANVFAFIVSLPQFLPMFNQMNLSETRGQTMSWGSYISLKNVLGDWWYSLFNIFPNEINTFGGNVSFIGTITLALVIIAIVNLIVNIITKRKIQSYTFVFIILGLFALSWSAGDSLIGQFFYQIPIFNRFRWMFKLVIFVDFYLIALAAIGFQYLIAYFEKTFPSYNKIFKVHNLIAFTIIALQLGQFAYIYTERPIKYLRYHQDPLPLVEPLKEELKDGRIVSMGADSPYVAQLVGFNYATLFDLYHFGGYEPLLSVSNNSATFGLNHLSLYGSFNNGLPTEYEYFRQWGVKWYVVQEGFSESEGVEIKLPLAYTGYKRKIYIDNTTKPLFFRKSDETSNGIESKINTNSIELKVNNKQEDEIYVLFLYNKFFKAKIDGKDVQINRDDFGRMLIKVPEGQHNVIIRYTEPYMLAGFVIMILTISGSITLYLIYKKKKKYEESTNDNHMI